MGTSDLPDMYAQSPRVYISGKFMSAYVTTKMYPEKRDTTEMYPKKVIPLNALICPLI